MPEWNESVQLHRSHCINFISQINNLYNPFTNSRSNQTASYIHELTPQLQQSVNQLLNNIFTTHTCDTQVKYDSTPYNTIPSIHALTTGDQYVPM